MCSFVWLISLCYVLIEVVSSLQVVYNQKEVRIKEGEFTPVNFTLTDKIHRTHADEHLYYYVKISSPSVADIGGEGDIKLLRLNKAFLHPDKNGIFNYSGSIGIMGKLLGHTNLFLEYVDPNVTYLINDNPPCALKEDNIFGNDTGYSNRLAILVSLKHSRLEKIFTLSVIILVLLNFINMGCAVDLIVIKSVIKKPIAPLIGLVSQYFVMPLTSFIVGYLFFSGEAYYYWFGLFAFGCSPGGNASNMWTLLFDGNLNLSLTMTFISTFCALFMIPLWLFTLGVHIQGPNSSFTVPYIRIFESLIAMAFFLGIGLLFQKYLPKVSKACKRILAPISSAMIIFIVVFSTYVYWSMVKLLTWKMLLSAGLNVWIGFFFGLIFSNIFCFSRSDQITIAIETGIQNTGISIMLIRLALRPPESDLAALLPVAASIMTPIPLMILLLVKKCSTYVSSSHKTVIYASPEDSISFHKHLRTPQSVNFSRVSPNRS